MKDRIFVPCMSKVLIKAFEQSTGLKINEDLTRDLILLLEFWSAKCDDVLITKDSETVHPSQCRCIHADDTIGVRPIWVDVKDRLPKEGERVLVLSSKGMCCVALVVSIDEYLTISKAAKFIGVDAERVCCGKRISDIWQLYPIGSDASYEGDFDVTHWMPLPHKPYNLKDSR